MYPQILLFLLPLVLLVVATACVLLWDRKERLVPKNLEAGNGRSEGQFRSFYHMLWVLVLWAGLGLSLPLWFSYKQKIEGLPMPDRLVLIGKILAFPLILLALLTYGARQGYLKWIDSLDWPDKENE
jgi:hypothetical protein